jgi:hypothetical protein
MVAAFGGAGVLFAPSAASAQFMFGGIGGLRPLPSLPAPNIVPPLRPLSPLAPLMPLPGLRPLPMLPNPNVVPPLTPLPNLGLGVPTPWYSQWRSFQIGPPGASIGFSQYYWSAGVTPWAYWGGWNYPPYGYGYASGGASTYGGIGSDWYAKELARGQRDAELDRKRADAMARPQIAGAWEYENGVAAKKLPEIKGGTSPEAQEAALHEADPAAIAAGDPLNHLLYAVVAADTRNAKLPSLYLRPDLLSQIRFGGSPAADALNLLRSGRVQFPAAFDEPGMVGTREAIEKEFATILTAAKANRPVDGSAVARLAEAVKAAQDRLTPAIKDLTFEDAVAARRFLNQLEGAAKVLREPSTAGLLNSKWQTEGASVSDLTRFMARHKLLFGPAEKGDEETYTTLHRGLGGYLMELRKFNSPKK